MTSTATAGMKPLIDQPIAPPAPTPTDTSSQTSQSKNLPALNKRPSEGTFGSGDHADQPVGGVSEAKLQRAIERLENRIDQEGARVRKELRQELKQDFQREVDRLDGKIDALGTSMTTQFGTLTTRMFETQRDISKLDTRMDGLDTRMNGLDTRMDGLTTRMDGLEEAMKTMNTNMQTLNTNMQIMNTNMQTILQLLQHHGLAGTLGQQLPVVFAQPPSSEGHGTDNAPGPSSPRGRQTLSTKSSNVSLASASKLAHTIRRSASELVRKLSRAKEDEDGAGPSE